MKKLSLLLLASLFMLTAALTGCGRTSSAWSGYCSGAEQQQNSDSVSLSCDEFDGGVTYTIHVTEDDRLIIDSEFVVAEGSLDVTIEDSDNNVLFYGVISSDWYFNTILPEYGTYYIIIEADEFKGSYIFSWAQ
jgi:hypothetical protein